MFKLFLLAAAVIGVTTSEENEKLFSKSLAVFTEKFSTEVEASKPGQSVVFSAFSVEPLLAQLSLGTEGVAHAQILTALGIPDDQFTRSVFPDVLAKLNATKGVTLNLASALYTKDGYELNENFKKDSIQLFNSDIQTLDFSKSAAAANTINSWVSSKTNNKIKDLISADDLSADTRLVMCNAIYFKGTWKKTFDSRYTRDQDFHVSSTKTVQIPAMSMKSTFKYAESSALNAKILEIPYEGEEVSMVIILPNEIEGLAAVQNKLKDVNVFDEELKNLVSQEVQVQIPKFKIETTTDLGDLLKKIGVQQIFSETNSGLVKLLKTKEQLSVSKAVQKAFIEVNEEGTEAAAANAVVAVAFSASFQQDKYFIANRPFLFTIRSNELELFSGTFRN